MEHEELRRVLLAHSDHRAVRNVFGALTGDAPVDLRDHVETMRVTGGEVALVAADGAAEVYARWHRGTFEYVTVWPPWSVGAHDHADREEVEAFLAEKTDVGPVLHDKTPFADPEVLGDEHPF